MDRDMDVSLKKMVGQTADLNPMTKPTRPKSRSLEAYLLHRRITADPGMVVRLTFNTFSLEHNEDCDYDFVEISDNFTSTQTGGFRGR